MSETATTDLDKSTSRTADSKLRVHITAFGPFMGVKHNPTEHLVQQWPSINYEHTGWKIVSLNVLKTSAKSVDHEMSHDNPSSILNRTTEDMLSSEEFTQPFLWLHLGVNENSTGFAIEAVAHNEATFRVPDECDFQPMKEAIVPSDGDYMQCRETSLPVDEIVDEMATLFPVKKSTDAGRFVCNYIFYKSLKMADQMSKDSSLKGHSVFVHVPPFYHIDAEDQLKFLQNLLDVISTRLR